VNDGQPVIWVQGLPGSRQALVVACADQCQTRELHVLDLATGSSTLLLPGVLRAWYARTGHLVYVLEDGGVFAAPFSLRRLELMGPGVRIFGDVRRVERDPDIHLATDGTLLYAVPPASQLAGADAVGEFVWVTRGGEVSRADSGFTFVPQGGRARLRLSPDGRRVAYDAAVEGNVDVWVKDLFEGTTSRVTFADGFDGLPVWFPDGETIAFAHSDGQDLGALSRLRGWRRRVDGRGDAGPIPGASLQVRAVSPDAERLILYRGGQGDNAGQRGIFVLRVGVDSVPVPLIASDEFSEGDPALSWDGLWIAYVSNETGRNEVIVRPFPSVDGGWWQVSEQGGMAPRWAHNGRELFFWDQTSGEFKVAEFTTDGAVFRRGRVTSLFAFSQREYLAGALDPFYDVGPDDERFLFVRDVDGGDTDDAGKPTLVLVQNFFEELERMVPAR